MIVVCQLRPVPLREPAEKVTEPTNPGGAGSRFFSERRSGVAGSGKGGAPSPPLRRSGDALGGIPALGLTKSSADATTPTMPIVNAPTKSGVNQDLIFMRRSFCGFIPHYRRMVDH